MLNQPQAPDPLKTATAQANLSHVNQTGPFASQQTTQTGTNPDGTPQYTAATTLNGAAGTLQDQIGQNLSKPLDFSAQKDYLTNFTNQNLDYNFDRGQKSLDTSLANKGLKIGDEAYTNAQRDYTTNRGAAYNAAALNNFTTAQNSAIATRDLPIGELGNLLSGTATPAPSNGGTNFGQLAQNQYDNQNSQVNGFWGGLGNIASTAGNFLFSDERLKTDIGSKLSETSDGIPIRPFRYKGSPLMQMGVIAQEAEKKRPDAVVNTPRGKMVNYAKVGSPMLALGRKAA